MGAAASHKEEEKAARARAIRAKIKAVAALTPSSSNCPAKCPQIIEGQDDVDNPDPDCKVSSEEKQEEEGQLICDVEEGEEPCEDSLQEECEQGPSVEREDSGECVGEQDGQEVQGAEGEDRDGRELREYGCKADDLEEEDNANCDDESGEEDTFTKSEEDEEEDEVDEEEEKYDEKTEKIEESTEKEKKKTAKGKEKMSRSKAIRTKIRALASLAPNLPVHRKVLSKENKKKAEERAPIERQESKREELLDFVKARKDSRRENWSEYEKECESPTRGRRTAWQYVREKLEVESGVGDVTMGVRECKMCKVDTNFDGMPICRVCGKGYHRQCLIKSGLYTEHELKFVERANTALGWSCVSCDNIFNLLTPTELDELSNEFERLDMNKDGKISVDEYLTYRRAKHEREWGEPMTELDEQFEKTQFKYLDADGGGFIEYSEFLKHESCVKLSFRTKAELAKMLMPREVLQARQVFEKLDDNEDGYVTSADAKHAYRSWYTNLLKNIPKDTLGEKSPEEVYGTGEIKASLVVDDEGDTTRTFDWNEFLQNRAIYIVSSRPNKAAAFIIPKD